MPNCVVLFDPLDHTEESFVPPDGVVGGIVGDTPAGIMGVYDVPPEHGDAFDDALAACNSVVDLWWIAQEQTR
jgi:hypothetical protein